ncbi:response regulator transcription factor [Pseudoalteromonas prydzensis]|uniref:response regulator transcription factor n=1 Tax=Pseudoalteromonas prydzensis TaxID=182141 RepID=UPI0007E505C0|nr:response regulator transcription factor [Pseudoalteromonas prydzensis]MBE0377624.1 hypothetical protein [Pseudoalteromonas prydzensis ACAM 620]
MVEKVLIVEDDLDIADLVRVNLHELGIQTEHLADGQSAMLHLATESYSLLLLDIMLPNVSGLDICRHVRQHHPEQAIIMLTAKDSEMDRVLGLELGADDYMTKPFSVRELQARVRAQLRKVQLLRGQIDKQAQDTYFNLGNLHIDLAGRQAKISTQVLDLTATEFELLHYLAKHPNKVFSRSHLLESVWGYHHSGYEHTVNSHINRLRAKVEHDAAAPQIIQTVWGVGYKLNALGLS